MVGTRIWRVISYRPFVVGITTGRPWPRNELCSVARNKNGSIDNLFRFMVTLHEGTLSMKACHDDVAKWKHIPCYLSFVPGIDMSPMKSPHKGQWRSVLLFFLTCDCALNRRLSKHSEGWWLGTPSRSLWHHCNEYKATVINLPLREAARLIRLFY